MASTKEKLPLQLAMRTLHLYGSELQTRNLRTKEQWNSLGLPAAFCHSYYVKSGRRTWWHILVSFPAQYDRHLAHETFRERFKDNNPGIGYYIDGLSCETLLAAHSEFQETFLQEFLKQYSDPTPLELTKAAAPSVVVKEPGKSPTRRKTGRNANATSDSARPTVSPSLLDIHRAEIDSTKPQLGPAMLTAVAQQFSSVKVEHSHPTTSLRPFVGPCLACDQFKVWSDNTRADLAGAQQQAATLRDRAAIADRHADEEDRQKAELEAECKRLTAQIALVTTERDNMAIAFGDLLRPPQPPNLLIQHINTQSRPPSYVHPHAAPNLQIQPFSKMPSHPHLNIQAQSPLNIQTQPPFNFSTQPSLHMQNRPLQTSYQQPPNMQNRRPHTIQTLNQPPPNTQHQNQQYMPQSYMPQPFQPRPYPPQQYQPQPYPPQPSSYAPALPKWN